MRLYNRLRRIRGQLNSRDDFAIKLPQLIFCGNQSSGKSSIVEAISGVPLPRNNNTTTRVKTELRMLKDTSPGATFRCSILLHRAGGDEIMFGHVITEKIGVELQVKRAQKALLNPQRNPEDFLEWNPAEEPIRETVRGLPPDDDSYPRELEFTDDTMVLQINDPDVYNLTLVDLPGLITNHIIEQNVDIVDRLNDELLSDPNSIIIAAVNCVEDENLAKILSLARRHDPSGERTLGVLTKLDRVEEGNRARILSMINSSATAPQLRLGYYAVRNRTQRELANGVSFERARENEERFFRQEDWLSDLRASGRCGIPALKKRLSELLMDKLRPLINEIEYHCQRMAARVQSQLNRVPNVVFRSPSELQEKTANLVHSFSMKINNAVNATTKDKGLWHDVLEEFRLFEVDLYGQRPVFQTNYGDIVSVKLQGHQRITEDYERIRKNSSHASQVNSGQLWDAERVQRIISEQRGLDGVYFDVFDAVRKIVSDHQVGWEIPTIRCVEGVHKVFSEYVKRVASQVFSGSYAKVSASICKILDQHLKISMDISIDITVKRLYKMEAPEVYGQSIFTMREVDTVTQLEAFFPQTQGPSAILNKVDMTVTSLVRSINGAIKNSNVAELCVPLTGLINEWHSLSGMLGQSLDSSLKSAVDSVTETSLNLQKLVTANADFAQISVVVTPWIPIVLKTIATIQPDMIQVKPVNRSRPANNRSRDGTTPHQRERKTFTDDLTDQSTAQIHRVMAGALSYYSIAHYRYLDNVVRAIYIILLADFARDMAQNLFTKLGLLVGASGTVDVSQEDWESMVKEDVAVTRGRDRLQSLRSELDEIIRDANIIKNSS